MGRKVKKKANRSAKRSATRSNRKLPDDGYFVHTAQPYLVHTGDGHHSFFDKGLDADRLVITEYSVHRVAGGVESVDIRMVRVLEPKVKK